MPLQAVVTVATERTAPLASVTIPRRSFDTTATYVPFGEAAAFIGVPRVVTSAIGRGALPSTGTAQTRSVTTTMRSVPAQPPRVSGPDGRESSCTRPPTRSRTRANDLTGGSPNSAERICFESLAGLTCALVPGMRGGFGLGGFPRLRICAAV